MARKEKRKGDLRRRIRGFRQLRQLKARGYPKLEHKQKNREEFIWTKPYCLEYIRNSNLNSKFNKDKPNSLYEKNLKKN